MFPIISFLNTNKITHLTRRVIDILYPTDFTPIKHYFTIGWKIVKYLLGEINNAMDIKKDFCAQMSNLIAVTFKIVRFINVSYNK